MPHQLPPDSYNFIRTFEVSILPIFPILPLSDVSSLHSKYTTSFLGDMERVCLSLIIEIGSLIYTIDSCRAPPGLSLIRSSNIANAARCIRIEKTRDLDYVRACLLMSLFLRQTGQSYDQHLRQASCSLSNLSTMPLDSIEESIDLAWLSMTCLALYVQQ